MPAIVTHHVFGMEAHRQLGDLIGTGDAERDAFLLGNIGPDPLFCLKALPKSQRFKNIGRVMHTQDPTELLASMHRHFIIAPGNRARGAVRAYALGFVCHYLLDSTVHPLVYAQQFALCDAGIAGLTRKQGGREVHALIETELDEYVLTTRLSTTVGSFSPHREILRCSDASLVPISSKFPTLIREAYGLGIPPSTFVASVRLYRSAQRALDSKRDGLRQYFDYARILGKSYLHVQALTHTDRDLPQTPFTNSEHITWPHPFEEGATFDECFDDLYDRAFERALSVLPLYAQADYSASACEELTLHVNFHGKRCLP